MYYGNLSQDSFKKYVKNCNKNRRLYNSNKQVLLNSLEMRLDTVLFRSNFTTSMRHSIQIIAHNQVMVNGKIAKRKSLNLKKGDIVSLSKKIHHLAKNSIISKPFWPLPPKTLQINYKTLQITILSESTEVNSSSTHNFKLELCNIINKFS